AIASQKAAFSQFPVWKASSVATPKKSRNTVKLAPSLSLFMAVSSDHKAKSGRLAGLWLPGSVRTRRIRASLHQTQDSSTRRNRLGAGLPSQRAQSLMQLGGDRS